MSEQALPDAAGSGRRGVAGALLRGAVVGALLLAALQGLAVGWAALTTSGDATTARATAAIARLGERQQAFALELVVGVAAFGALLGVAQALLRVMALAPGTRPTAGVLQDALATALLALSWVLYRDASMPALLGPALPWGGLDVPFDPHFLLFPPLLWGLWLLLRALRYQRGLRTGIGLAALSLVLTGADSAPVQVGGAGAVPGSRPRNVLILAGDSVRSDRLSGLGYGRPTTPNLDALMARGTTFSRAYAPLANTSPSWVSMLTGLYPHNHGIRHMFPGRWARTRSLPTVVHRAAEAGLQTRVFSDYAGDFFPLFDFGFQTQSVAPPLNVRTLFERALIMRSPLALAFLEPLPEALRPDIFRYLMTSADPERLAEEVIDSLDRSTASGPDGGFFTVAFFSTTHLPFAAPWPWHRVFTDPDYEGPHRFAYDVGSLADIKRAEEALSPEDATQVNALYDGALAATDAAIGRILDALDERGLRDDTVVVFLADHGENLFEPGQTTLHGRWFRGGDEANRVPFIVAGPGIASGLRVDEAISLIDVGPTLAELAGLAPIAPSETLDGISLVGATRGQPLDPERAIFAESGTWLSGPPSADAVQYPGVAELLIEDEDDDLQIVLRPRFENVVVRAKHRAVWQGDHKLVYEPTRTGVQVQLFNLATDPSQSTDVIATDPKARALRQRLQQFLGADPLRELDLRGHVISRRGG